MKTLVAILIASLWWSPHSWAEGCRALDPFSHDLSEHHYLLGILAKTKNGRLSFAHGRLTDGHDILKDRIEATEYSPVVQILWAGEIQGDKNGVIAFNSTAGIHERADPELVRGATASQLPAILENSESLKFALRPDTQYLSFEKHPENFLPELKEIARFRHDFFGGSYGLALGLSDAPYLTDFEKAVIVRDKVSQLIRVMKSFQRVCHELFDQNQMLELNAGLEVLERGESLDPQTQSRFLQLLKDLEQIVRKPSNTVTVTPIL